jgi:hypothetical protein
LIRYLRTAHDSQHYSVPFGAGRRACQWRACSVPLRRSEELLACDMTCTCTRACAVHVHVHVHAHVHVHVHVHVCMRCGALQTVLDCSSLFRGATSLRANGQPSPSPTTQNTEGGGVWAEHLPLRCRAAPRSASPSSWGRSRACRPIWLGAPRAASLMSQRYTGIHFSSSRIFPKVPST